MELLAFVDPSIFWLIGCGAMLVVVALSISHKDYMNYKKEVDRKLND